MSLSSNVNDLATRIATEFKTIRSFLLSNHPRTVKASGGVYPARPTGAAQVIWVGHDPGASALDGDIWVSI